MAEIEKSGTPSISNQTPPQASQIGAGLIAGEDIEAGDACYITSDGTVKRSDGSAADEAAEVRGFAAMEATEGEAVTLFRNVTFRYGSGLTPGINVYLSDTTPGGLDDAPTTGGVGPIGFVVDDTRIYLHGSLYQPAAEEE